VVQRALHNYFLDEVVAELWLLPTGPLSVLMMGLQLLDFDDCWMGLLVWATLGASLLLHLAP
jgi:hypothetical protein